MTTRKRKSQTYAEVHYAELTPNPLNPRRLFDKYKLDILEESIRKNKVLVPLTVYREERTGKLVILDGERRWRCAMRIELGEVSVELDAILRLAIPNRLHDVLSIERSTRVVTHRGPIDEQRRDELFTLASTKTWRRAVESLYAFSQERPPMKVVVPVNIVDPPDAAANMLYMFHTHNLREQWELMPTALSLQILMKELNEDNDEKLANLTKLSLRHVQRCKVLLSFAKKYQSMMLSPDPDARIKANLFIEMAPVLDFYGEMGPSVCGGKDRNELTDVFINKYRIGKIPSVLHFRRILEARDNLEGTDRWSEVRLAAKKLVSDEEATIKGLFDPLTLEEKTIGDAKKLCNDFLKRLKTLNLEHITKRKVVVGLLETIQKEVTRLLQSMEGDE